MKNISVSWDHRTQTSTANTTKRARRPTNSGYLPLLLPSRVGQGPPIHVRASLFAVTPQPAGRLQREPTHQPPPIIAERLLRSVREIKVSHKGVGGDSPANLRANPSNHAFQQIPSPPPLPTHPPPPPPPTRAQPARWCHESRREGHLQWRAVKEIREEGGASRSSTQKELRLNRSHAAQRAFGQRRKSACPMSPNLANSSTSLNLCSVREAAS